MSASLKKDIAQHARKANEILASLHQLCCEGKINLMDDVDDGVTWDYEWVLLEHFMEKIPLMETAAIAQPPIETPYTGCWVRKAVSINFHIYGYELTGALTVTRSGPGLERTHWSWFPRSMTENQPPASANH